MHSPIAPLCVCACLPAPASSSAPVSVFVWLSVGLFQLWHLCPLNVQWQHNFCLSLNVDAKHPMPNPIPIPVSVSSVFQLHLGNFAFLPPPPALHQSLNKWPTTNCKLFFSISAQDLFRTEGNLDNSYSPGSVADAADSVTYTRMYMTKTIAKRS